jgi:hypothetical protein
MMEDIQKTTKGRIMGVPFSLASVFGQMERQGSVRSQQSKEMDEHLPRPTRIARPGCGNGRGSKGQGWHLSQTHRILGGPLGSANAWPIAMGAFEQSQGLEEIESIRVGAQFLPNRYRL